MPIRGLYATYHLLLEAETTIDWGCNFSTCYFCGKGGDLEEIVLICLLHVVRGWMDVLQPLSSLGSS